MADPGEVEPRDVSRSILPPLAPLPPQQSSSDQFHTHKATKPIGKVLPFNVDSIDPSELTLTPLPPHPPSQPQAPSPYKSNQDDACTFLPDKPSHSSTPSTPPSDNPTHTHLSSPLPTFGHAFLPANKGWHMFVSHSTSDTQLVHESLIVPLGDTQRSVAACYNFMPDTSRYNDHEIKDAMKESVVVAIGLSPAYIHSDRCRREYEYAIHLYNNKMITSVIVLAFQKACSRPQVLKRFLYLDFIDRSKRSTVWVKMEECIDEAVRLTYEQCHKVKEKEEKIGTRSPISGGSSPLTSERSSSLRHTEYAGIFEDAILYMREKGDVPSEDEDIANYGEEERGGDNWGGDQDEWGGIEGGGFEERSFDVSEDGVDSDRGEGRRCEEDNSREEVTGEEGVLNEEERNSDRGDEDKAIARDEGGGGGGGASEEVEGVTTEKKTKRRRLSDIEDGEVSDSSDDEAQMVAKKQRGLSGSEDEEGLEQSEKVQRFYNQLAVPGADRRDDSPILFMRGFNNWVKSILIRTYLLSSATVLDLCCGKGGDLNKWKEGRIHYLVGADISETSIETCMGRYHSNKLMDRRSRKPVFEAEFIVADCCQVRLQDRYENPARRFHMTSCQFSLHYAFESHERATMMLRNACENLRPGGYFIGTTVDANELISRLRDNGVQDESGCWCVGNEVYSVTLDSEFDPHDSERPLPLFGCKYHFKLAGVVNVPEFLLHYPLLVQMLKEWDMVEVRHQNFYEFFSEHRHIPEDASLLYRMQAFDKKTGTMSGAEWEAIGLYLVFVFQKRTQ